MLRLAFAFLACWSGPALATSIGPYSFDDLNPSDFDRADFLVIGKFVEEGPAVKTRATSGTGEVYEVRSRNLVFNVTQGVGVPTGPLQVSVPQLMQRSTTKLNLDGTYLIVGSRPVGEEFHFYRAGVPIAWDQAKPTRWPAIKEAVLGLYITPTRNLPLPTLPSISENVYAHLIQAAATGETDVMEEVANVMSRWQAGSGAVLRDRQSPPLEKIAGIYAPDWIISTFPREMAQIKSWTPRARCILTTKLIEWRVAGYASYGLDLMRWLSETFSGAGVEEHIGRGLNVAAKVVPVDETLKAISRVKANGYRMTLVSGLGYKESIPTLTQQLQLLELVANTDPSLDFTLVNRLSAIGRRPQDMLGQSATAAEVKAALAKLKAHLIEARRKETSADRRGGGETGSQPKAG